MALLVALLGPMACTTWRTQSDAPGRVVAESSPGHVLVTLADGRTLRLREPRVVRDSLVGRRDDAPRGADSVALPLASVKTIAVRRVDRGRTVLLLLGVATAALLVWAYAVWRTVETEWT